MFKGINATEFGKRFYDNERCCLYLAEQKWGKGSNCSRCGHKKYYKGKTYYHRKCRACGYGESVTANTIFYGIKMPMLKYFHIIFRLIAKKKGMSQQSWLVKWVFNKRQSGYLNVKYRQL